MLKRVLLTVFCLGGLAVLGCGGGGGGDDGGDPLSLLEGTWLGRTTGGSLQLTIGADGAVTQVLRNGADTGDTGTVVHIFDRYFEGSYTSGPVFRLFLDPTASYATLWGDPFLAAMQKNAMDSITPPAALADIAPGAYDGLNFTINDELRATATVPAVVTIDVAGMLAGTDQRGITFGSPPAQPLEARGTFFDGPYRDSAHPTTGIVDVVASPDQAFLAVASFPEMNNIITNAAFLGAWSRR